MKMRLFAPLVFTALLPNVAFAQAPSTTNVDLGVANVTFVRIAAGTFTMGSSSSDPGRKDDELAHSVTLSNGFYIQTTPVTVGVWKRFVDATGYRSEAEKGTSGGSGWNGSALVQGPSYNWKSPGFPQTDEHPVTIITYEDALQFTRWATRITKRSMTLPTEAQWEYAYRAGTTSTYYDINAKDPLALGWFKDNAGQGTKPVGQKKPNAWGLYDMGGNVWEWCLDWYAPYAPANATDPMQTVADASDKPRRVLRGGSWLKDRSNGRAAARFRSTPGTRNADNGFRLVILDQAPDLTAEAPVPNQPLPAQSPPPVHGSNPSSNSDTGFFACFGSLFVLPFIGVFIFIFWKLIKSVTGGKSGGSGGRGATSMISVRPGKDGFWMHPNGHHRGAQVTINYRSMGITRVAHARVENPNLEQFVYTGYTPEILEVVHVTSTNSSWQPSSNSSNWSSRRQHSSSRHNSWDNHHSSSNDSSFGGYPPAY